MSKKSFVMYSNWAEMLAEMPAEQAGVLIKAISCYSLGKDFEIDDPVISAVFTMIRSKLDEDRSKYDEKVERVTKMNESKRNRDDIETKSTRNRDDIVGDTVNDTVTVIHNTVNNTPPNPPQKGKRFVPPTVEEVREYCKQSGHNVNPEEFVDFYSSKGWKVGSASMKDWKAAVRTWSRRKEKPQNSFHNFDQRENGGIGDMLRKKQIAAVMKGG